MSVVFVAGDKVNRKDELPRLTTISRSGKDNDKFTNGFFFRELFNVLINDLET